MLNHTEPETMDHTSEKLLQNRFLELAERADQYTIFTDTDFLGMAEQNILLSMRLPMPYTFYGGYEGAERRIACFGSLELCGYEYLPPITCVCIRPAMQKFAEKLTHRDILGALMSLGIERKATGDILIEENVGYVFCLEEIAEYILRNLSSVRHTSVKCSIGSPPESLSQPPESVSRTVSSDRLDALIAEVYQLGRSAAKELVLSERVYLNGRLTTNAGISVPEDSIVSVRGHGRFRYEGMLRTTKKGRLSVRVKIY